MDKNNNKPVYEMRLGHVRIAVWRNFSEGGTKEWFNASLSRRYLKDGVWQETNTFNGLADLTLVGECIAQAKDWIARQEEQA